MVRASTCLLHGQEINVDEALRLRDQARWSGNSDPDFRCTGCEEPVRPHKAGGHAEAHFEHLSRNPDCHLSDT